MNIAIASGKGGTGKTTLAASLAAWCARKGMATAILDCDVEEPDANLFVGAPVASAEPAHVLIPKVDDDLCTGCGECERICAYSAIVLIKGLPLVLPEMCHSCGGCYLVCPERAIHEVEKRIGVVESGAAGELLYAGGRLDLGEPMSPPLIREVKKQHPGADVKVLDCPPGTSCPVVESVRGSDFIVLVTEPTPFGLNDLKLAVAMARALGVPFGVVINRDGTGNAGVRDYCAAEGIDVVASIPYSRELAVAYALGKAVPCMLEAHDETLAELFSRVSRNVCRAGA